MPAAAKSGGKFSLSANLFVLIAQGDTANKAAANAVYNQTNLAFRRYVAYDATTWYTDPETIA